MTKFGLLRRFKKMQRDWPTFWRTTLGSAMYASSLAFFVLPAKFPDSGVAGAAVLLKYLWDIPPAPVIFALNIVLFIYGWKVLSKRFLFWTLWSVTVFSLTLQILEPIPAPHVTDRFLVVVAAAALRGIAWAIVISGGGSLGGTDILASAIYRKTGMEIGRFSFAVHVVTVIAALPVVGFENLLYGAALLYLSCLVFDSTTQSFDRRKQVLVVSSKQDEVKWYITKKLRQGVTMLYGQGGYTGKEMRVLLAMLFPRQVADLKKFLRETDPRAFVVLYEASEIFGRRFKPLNRERTKPLIRTRTEAQSIQPKKRRILPGQDSHKRRKSKPYNLSPPS